MSTDSKDLSPDVLGIVFRRRTAFEAGISDATLRTSAFVRVRRDGYTTAATDPLAAEAHSWLTLTPGAAMYGLTAARWYGLPAPEPDVFHVIVPRGTALPRKRPGFQPHHGYVDESEVVVHRGLPVTSPERTWLDLSLPLGRTDLVAVGDAMVQAGLTTPERLVAAAHAARGRRKIVKTRDHARLVRAGVDSPPETAVRLIMLDGDLPEPEVNPDVFDEVGGWIGRPDLAYVGLKIAIQYEGDVHRANRRRWQSDIARDEIMADNGWVVIRVTARDLTRPWHLCQRIRSAIRRQQSRRS